MQYIKGMLSITAALDQMPILQSPTDRGHMVPDGQPPWVPASLSACTPAYTCVLRGMWRAVPYLLHSEQLLKGGKNTWHRLQTLFQKCLCEKLP